MTGSWRELTRVFLKRFFDHDITGGADDMKLSFVWLLAFLAMPGVIMPILQAWAVSWNGQGVDAGWIMTASRDGLPALRAIALADKAFYLGYAAVATAVLSAMAWNSLLLDRRDALVLGNLPVRPVTIIAAKLSALVLYVGTITVCMNVLSAVMFGALLATGNTFTFAMRGIGAHLVASCGLGAFVVLSMAAVQSLGLVVAGPRLFARVAAWLQLGVAILIALSLFAIPLISTAMPSAMSSLGTSPWIFRTPTAWFVGLYEMLVGGSVPATAWPLARTAMTSLFISGAAVTLLYPFGYRRLIRDGHGAASRAHRSLPHFALTHMTRLIAGRHAQVRAVTQFMLTTFARVERHRFVLAGAVGVAIAWALPTVLALSRGSADVTSREAFAMPFAAVLWLLVGARIAASLPGDLSSGWMFELLPPSRVHVRAAMRRSLVALSIVPTVAVALAINTALFGFAFAFRHGLVMTMSALVLLEILLWGHDALPCSTPWRPERARLRAFWPVYLLGFAAFTRGIPALGSMVSGSLPATAVLAAVLWSIAAIIRSRSDSRLKATPIAPPDSPLADQLSWRERAMELLQELPHWPAHAWRDAPFAWRRLVGAPLFSLFAIATLALGIGATAATYSALRSLTTPQFGVGHASTLALITQYRGGQRPANLSWPDYEDLRAAASSFSALSAWSSVPSGVSINGVAEMVAVEGVSGGGFDVAGIRVSIGRSIQADDDAPSAVPTAVISDSLWRARFAAGPNVIGQTIRLGGQPFVVIGVAPTTFHGALQQKLMRTSVWIPLTHVPAMFRTIGFPLDTTNRRHEWLRVLGRLHPGAAMEDASRDVRQISARLDTVAPRPGTTRDVVTRGWAARPAADVLNAQASPIIGLLYFSLPGLLLLIACSNLANLVLSRGVSRQHDLAVRQALGASRSRVIREQLIESAYLAAAGAAGGVLVAHAILLAINAAIQRTLGDLPQYRMDTSFGEGVIIPAMAAAGITVIIAGLAPALPLTRDALRRALATAAGSAVPQWRGRAKVITAQVALSTGMLLVASLFVRQLVTDLAHPERPALDSIGVVALPLGAQQRDEVAGRRIIDRVLADARQRPGLANSAAVSLTERDFNTPLGAAVIRPGHAANGGDDARLHADLIIGSNDMFRVLQLPIRFGRPFDDRDGASGSAVAVIGVALARELFGRDDATGLELFVRDQRINGPATDRPKALRVVGVTDDWATGAAGNAARTIYVPWAQDYTGEMAVIGTSKDADGATAAALLRQLVHDADPDLATSFAGSASVAANQQSRLYALATAVVSTLAALAVVLAMTGLYGVLNHLVGRRTREIGVRMALGASSRDITALVLREGLRPVIIGLIIGAGIGALLRLSLQPFFTRATTGIDAVAIVVAALPLLAAAWLACYLPARRASRVAPTDALRHT